MGFSLLAASLLAFWGLCTAAQLTIESVPFNAVEGKDVLLLVHNTRENLLVYRWFKGERAVKSFGIATYAMTTQVNTPGPAHSGQETVYPNGSLLFQTSLRMTRDFTPYKPRTQILGVKKHPDSSMCTVSDSL
jgi:hypothetical protein